jgi:hypothetical protein
MIVEQISVCQKMRNGAILKAMNHGPAAAWLHSRVIFRDFPRSAPQARMLHFRFGHGGYFHDNVLNGDLVIRAASS